MHYFVRQGKKILLEGAQGLLLSVEHGTYPYLTSSDCSINGTASGVGLSARAVDLTFGVFKFPFMTRVGAGPFPTELGGVESERYCAQDSGNRLIDELKRAGVPFEMENVRVFYNRQHSVIKTILNYTNNDFSNGVGIRLAAGEYGATTGRPRRTGWADAVAGKYAAGINGPFVAVLTKVDCLSGANEFKICYEYDIRGNFLTAQFKKHERFLRGVIPIYQSYRGYGDIRDVREYENLPQSLRKAVDDFEKFIGQRVGVISVGAEREEMIVR